MSNSTDPGGKPRLLIIEEESDAVSLLVETLQKEFDVALVPDGHKALESAFHPPHPDVILVAAQVGAMSGFDICRQLKANAWTDCIPVILMVGAGGVMDQAKSLAAGGADVIAKPFLPELARIRIWNHVETKRRRDQYEKLYLSTRAAGREIEQLKAELEGARQSLEVMSQELQGFNYSVSHDLRAPLRHMVGFSTALIEDYGAQFDGTAKLYLDCIGKAGRKMETLLDALLMLSRLSRQELNCHMVDLTSMARECAAKLKETAPERQGEFSIADDLSAWGDPALLRVLVQNLLENAWKYTGPRRKAQISVGQIEEGDVFFVRDNGVGFDMNYANRLFEVFQKLHHEAEFPGVGAGLAAVQRIVRRHGGRVWAESVQNQGATFYFTLAGIAPP